MQYIELRKLLGDFIIFSLDDIRQAQPGFHRRRLNEWQEKGYIKKITKGFYIFSDLQIEEKVLFEIANRIYEPSYISFETALSYYGLIPESVYGTTCASTRKTFNFNTPLGEFIYHAIQPKLYFGFEYVLITGSYYCKIASAEKALLDYFYINTSLNTLDDFASLRIDKESFLIKVNTKKLNDYADIYRQKSLKKRITAFARYIKHA